MTPKEALKQIANTTISSRIGDWGMESRHVSDLSSTKEPLQIIDQALTELEELKKRDTGMKVILTPYKKVVGNENEFYMGNMYTCPQCHGVLLMDRWQSPIETLKENGDILKYCSDCGQRLDWSDEK